mmetsp:Transcript_5568/g.16409  ORF Transcript_5568/g.16409 Transcript_5568/m.16409 type:complete len:210 (-) Transcript_5568:305-934(-)
MDVRSVVGTEGRVGGAPAELDDVQVAPSRVRKEVGLAPGQGPELAPDIPESIIGRDTRRRRAAGLARHDQRVAADRDGRKAHVRRGPGQGRHGSPDTRVGQGPPPCLRVRYLGRALAAAVVVAKAIHGRRVAMLAAEAVHVPPEGRDAGRVGAPAWSAPLATNAVGAKRTSGRSGSRSQRARPAAPGMRRAQDSAVPAVQPGPSWPEAR